MALSATAERIPTVSTTTTAELLCELKAAHSKLLGCMTDLRLLICGETPDQAHFSSVRWKLSAASLARRMLWVKILAHLRPVACKIGTERLRELQERDINLLRASTEHVGRWTAERAMEDWPGYCEACRTMLSKMGVAIQSEQFSLYRLLESAEIGDSHLRSPVSNIL